MGFSRNIKRALGLLYVLGLSFCAIGLSHKVETHAIQQYDPGMPYQGSYSMSFNTVTQQDELSFIEDNSGTVYFFEPQTAAYYYEDTTADISCTVYFYNEQTQEAETVSGIQVSIHLNDAAAELNAANGTYLISGIFPNTADYISYSVSAGQYSEDRTNNDPHIEAATGWVSVSGRLTYKYDSSTNATYQINYVTYHTETVEEQVQRNEIVFDVDVIYDGDTIFSHQSIQILNPEFDPEIGVGDNSFEGDVTGYCELTHCNTSISVNTDFLTYITDGWSYDPYNMALIYNDSAYPEPECTLEYVDINPDDEVVLQYYSEKYGMDFSATIINASIASGTSSDVVQGDIQLNNLQDYITVEVSLGNATIRNNVPNDGWNYDDNDHYIYYQDSQYPDSNYEIDSVVLKYTSQLVVFTCSDSEEFDTAQHTLTVSNPEYDETEGTIHGYTNDLEDPSTEVTISLGSNQLQEVEYWSFKYFDNDDESYFVWIDENAYEVRADSLTVSEAKFYSHSSDHTTDYLELEYTYQQTTLPSLILTGANKGDATLPTGGPAYQFNGWCDYPKIDDEAWVTLSVNDVEIIDAEKDNGWYFENETFVYYYNNTPITPTLVSSEFYKYGNSYNYAELTYSVTINDDPLTKTFTITDAGARTPEETQTQFYYISGFYDDGNEMREVSVKAGFLHENTVNYYTYDSSFIFMYTEEALELNCNITKVVFNEFGNGGNMNEAYVTLQPYNQRPDGDDIIEDGIETVLIENAVLRTDPSLEGVTEGSINGDWTDIFGETHSSVSITFSEDVFIRNDLQEGGEGFHYLNGLSKLIYFDDMGSYYDIEISDATYDVGLEQLSLSCYNREFDTTESLVLTNATYVDKSGDNEQGRYELRGYNAALFDGEMVLYTDNLYTQDSRQEGWNYIDNLLVWYDAELGLLDTFLESATLYRTVDSTKVEYVELRCAIYGLSRTDPDEITYKTAILTDVEIMSYPDPVEKIPGIIAGYFNALSMRIEVSTDEFIEKELNNEATTITPEQAEEIIEYMPEITPVTPEEEERQERNNESLNQLSEKTAAEILSAVSTSQSEITEELNRKIAEAGDDEEAKAQAQQEYQEKREILETVTEASVVVGADHQSATDEGNKIVQALPEDSGLDHMGETLNEFYQTQMDYLLGRKKAPEKRSILREPPVQATSGVDLTISKEEYGKMINFVDTSVANMKNAALQIRKCSNAKMKVVIKDYIQVVKISSFREFDKEAADAEFVEAAYKAIMLNMQQQVVETLKKEHKPSTNAEKERQYQEQLAACQDYDTFEQIVIEVLRLKYDSLSGDKLAYADVDDFFNNIYMPIFKSWALDDPSINPTNITLEELTQATIETTTTRATKFSFRTDLSKQETNALVIIFVVLGVGAVGGLTAPFVIKAMKRRKELAK